MIFMKLARSFLVGLLMLPGLFFAIETPAYDDSGWTAYRESNRKGEQVRHLIRVAENRFELKTELPGAWEHQVCLLDDTGQTIEWTYSDSSRDLQLRAVLLEERRVHLSGRQQGRALEKYFQLNRQPWNQRFQHGLASFLQSQENKTVFWAIGTRGPGELKITRFTVSRESQASPPRALLDSGRGPALQQLKISLHGLLAAFWSGRYWYDAADAGFLFYQGKSSYLDGEVTILREN